MLGLGSKVVFYLSVAWSGRPHWEVDIWTKTWSRWGNKPWAYLEKTIPARRIARTEAWCESVCVLCAWHICELEEAQCMWSGGRMGRVRSRRRGLRTEIRGNWRIYPCKPSRGLYLKHWVHIEALGVLEEESWHDQTLVLAAKNPTLVVFDKRL